MVSDKREFGLFRPYCSQAWDMEIYCFLLALISQLVEGDFPLAEARSDVGGGRKALLAL